jgi:hypothetical protein
MNWDVAFAVLTFLALALAGAAGGALLALHRLRTTTGANPDEIRIGAWTTNTLAGSSAANALTRARIAMHGILAMHRQEAIYFFSSCDDLGNPLDPNHHDWEIVGHGFDCRWWSFTLYDEDYQLIESLSRRYSVHSDNVALSPDGSYRIVISRANPGTNWLASGNARRLMVTLRLYNPSPAVLDDVRRVVLPSIRRIENGRAAA